MISHVTNRVNETAEQHLVPNWIDFLIVLQQVVVKLQNYLMCKSKATFWLGWGQKKPKQKTIVWWTHKFMLPENCRMISLCQHIMLNINAKNDSEWKIIIWISGPSPTISQIALKKWINVAFVRLCIIKWQEILQTPHFFYYCKGKGFNLSLSHIGQCDSRGSHRGQLWALSQQKTIKCECNYCHKQ